MFPCQKIFSRGHIYQCIKAGNILYILPWVRVGEQKGSMFGFLMETFSLEFGVLFKSVILRAEWACDSITVKQMGT